MKIEKQSSKFIKPFVPTPPTRRQYKLGFMDEMVPFTNVGVVLFFSTNSNDNPLAGKYVDERRIVDCNDQGVEFIYAKVNIKLEDTLVSKDLVKLIDEFIPSKADEALLAIQVSTFECGGVVIGANASHKIVDASTLSTFINEWAFMNREENKGKFIEGTCFKSSSLFLGHGLSSYPLPSISRDAMIL